MKFSKDYQFEISKIWQKIRVRCIGFPWLKIGELGLIALWVLWVGRNYLNLDYAIHPSGGEWGAHLVPYYFWDQLIQCGSCALWDGNFNGGMPALGNYFGSTMHPLAAIFSLIFGATNGMKLAVLAAFWLAGAAQWWMANTLKLGSLARIWSSLIVVVSGHLVVVLEPGVASLIISTASASLAIAATLALGVNMHRRNTLLLAMSGAFFILAGHGYLQFGLLWWVFAMPFLVLDKDFKIKSVWKEYLLAIVLSICLASIILIPVFHFLPNFIKPADPTFLASQSFEYLPLNLVIRDWTYFHTEILGKLPYSPTMYVGWVPVILALICIKGAHVRDYRALLFLTAGSILMLFVASAVPLRWIVNTIPGVEYFRSIILVSGLAVPGILLLAAYGLQYLQHALSSIKMSIITKSKNNDVLEKYHSIGSAWLVIPFLILSLSTSYQFSRSFFNVTDYHDQYDTVQQIPKASNLQWVQLPYGELSWLPVGIDLGYKQSGATLPYSWKDRVQPESKYYLAKLETLENTTKIDNISGINLFEDSFGNYAYVELSNGSQIPCIAIGQGGTIDVTCDVQTDGKLVVQENTISDWKVWCDGRKIPLSFSNQWLTVDAPAGKHTYSFRYLPWDVPLGAIISFTSFWVWLWLWKNRNAYNCDSQ